MPAATHPVTPPDPSLPDWLAHRAATTPERIALVASGRQWTFAQLDAEATTMAQRLAALGVRAGDRVATLLHNGAAPAILVHATLRLCATLVPLNVRLGEAEVAWQLADAAPRVLVVEARTATLADRARRESPPLRTVGLDPAAASHVGGISLDEVTAADVPLRLVHAASDVLAILYTSGTTGQPKGAMLTVGNFWWSAVGSALNLGTHADDRWLACMPLFHVGGLSILLRAAIYGIPAIVHDGFDADAVNHAIVEERVTIVSLVAVMLQRLLDARDDRPYPDALRCVLLGGGPAPQPLLERCARLGVPVVQTYGLTETTSQVATLAPEDALRRLGAAGRPLYPNALRIVAADGTDARTGEPGEIVVRGPVVMAGYAGRSEATARAIVDGWLRTGDIGRLDADGFLHVLDRRDDLVVSGGENVYPAEVEAVLLAHPSVAEAAVIGVPDDTWGQRVVAVVRLHDARAAHAGAAELLRAHCRAHLAGYKTPREFRLVTEPLPRTASGKLRRGEVRARLEV
jgi:O-succinylbenzoic acid--CoA ligase